MQSRLIQTPMGLIKHEHVLQPSRTGCRSVPMPRQFLLKFERILKLLYLISCNEFKIIDVKKERGGRKNSRRWVDEVSKINFLTTLEAALHHQLINSQSSQSNNQSYFNRPTLCAHKNTIHASHIHIFKALINLYRVSETPGLIQSHPS